MSNFWTQIWTNYKGLYDWINPRGYIANVIGFPIIYMIMFSWLGRFTADEKQAIFLTVGFCVSCMNYNIIGAITQSYATDRWYSTITLLYMSNANRFLNFISRCILHYPAGIIACTTAIITMRFVTNIDFGAVNWPGLALAVLVINLSICAFAQFLGVFSIIFAEYLNTVGLSLSVCLIFTGIVLPLDIFPAGLQEFGKLLPMTNGVFAARAAFIGAPFGDLYFDILRELITGIVFFGIGYLCFVGFEKVAKRTGALDRETD